MTPRERLKKRRPKQVKVDGESFTVRSLTIGETLLIQEMAQDASRQAKVPAFIASRCILDDDGSPLFSDESDADIGEIPTDTLNELANEIGRLSNAGSFVKIEKN